MWIAFIALLFAAEHKTYSNAAYGVAFELPASWTIHTEEAGNPNRRYLVINARPPGWLTEAKKSQHSVSDYPFRIRVAAFRMDREKAAEWAGFLRSNGKWMTTARGNNYDVRQSSRDGMFILSGTTDVGLYLKHGGYDGLGEGLRAFIFVSGRAAAIDAENTRYRRTFDQIVSSFSLSHTLQASGTVFDDDHRRACCDIARDAVDPSSGARRWRRRTDLRIPRFCRRALQDHPRR